MRSQGGGNGCSVVWGFVYGEVRCCLSDCACDGCGGDLLGGTWFGPLCGDWCGWVIGVLGVLLDAMDERLNWTVAAVCVSWWMVWPVTSVLWLVT